MDLLGNRYAGQGTARLKDGQWNVTFNWNNNASPTWVRVKPNADPSTKKMAGRRGKLDDRSYEGPYSCTKATK